MFDLRTYGIWRGMVQRCSNPKHISFRYYGAKGVEVCHLWRDFHAFVATMGIAPAGMTLDRIDSTKGYEPDNCRWATVFEQNNNKSNVRLLTHKGKRQHLTAWAKEIGVSVQTLHYRLVTKGWPVDLALTLPLVARSKRSAFKVDIR